MCGVFRYTILFFVPFDSLNSRLRDQHRFSAEEAESTISLAILWRRNMLHLKYSTDSFRYPCLVHVFPLIFIKAWTIPSPGHTFIKSQKWNRGQRVITVLSSFCATTASAIFVPLCGTPVSTGLKGSRNQPILYCMEGIMALSTTFRKRSTPRLPIYSRR